MSESRLSALRDEIDRLNQSLLVLLQKRGALVLEIATAPAWLDSAVLRGWTNLDHLQSNTDLSSLRTTAGWTAVTGKLRSIVDEIEKNYDRPLQKELIGIYEDDQGIRREFMAVVEKEGWKSPATDSLGKIDAFHRSFPFRYKAS